MWNVEKDNIIVELVKNGKSYNEIADLINKTPNSIRSRCYRLGVKSSDYKKDTNKKFNCLNCDKEFFDNIDRKFCSQSCSASFNNKFIKKRKDRYCSNCGKDIRRGKYCDNNCQTEYQHNSYIEKWKKKEVSGCSGKAKDLSTHIRQYMFEKYDNKCSMCDWKEVNEYTNKIPLQIDHIDGNHTNNKEENLRLLCPNCHSLTENYGSRNKGSGREYRRIKRQEKQIAGNA